jgi:hypothetical protein
MIRYALLLMPSANRVYAESAVAITQAELELFNRSVLSGQIGGITTERLGGIPYIVFDVEGDGLSPRDLGCLANLSSRYALFVREGDLLRPLELHPLDRFDDDLITIPKYAGKTNEQFTKLLLNVTLLSTAFAGELLDRRFRVLDPLCGRGTTLNQAMMYGFDAAGIDLDRKDFEAYSTFISTWLKRKRIKHQIEAGPVRREGRVVARRIQATLAPSREEYKAGETQRLDMVNADTIRAGEFFRKGTFDVVVADAPYGVQHGSRTADTLARNPLALLSAAVPTWAGLLRTGGALGISWNTNVARREDAVKALIDGGLEPAETEPYLGFRHRVDQAIVRDVIVARKS